MTGLPSWALWLIAVGILLSPVFAFIMAIALEVFVCLLREGGMPAVLIVIGGGAGWLLFRKRRARLAVTDLVGDQA